MGLELTKSKSKPKRAAAGHRSAKPASDSRAALLVAAQKHFAERGFKAASVHDIARDAGVNVSLVNYHFGNKEGLFKSCLETAGSDRLEVAKRVLSHEPESLEDVKVRIAMFIDEKLLDCVQNPEIHTIIHRDLEAEFELIEDEFQKTFLKTFQLLSGFIESAQKQGFLVANLDPNMTSVFLMGSMIQAVRTDHIRQRLFGQSIKHDAVRRDLRDQLVRLFFDGIAAKTESQRMIKFKSRYQSKD
jgi:AcrR family transcriptional regulator